MVLLNSVETTEEAYVKGIQSRDMYTHFVQCTMHMKQDKGRVTVQVDRQRGRQRVVVGRQRMRHSKSKERKRKWATKLFTGETIEEMKLDKMS